MSLKDELEWAKRRIASLEGQLAKAEDLSKAVFALIEERVEQLVDRAVERHENYYHDKERW